MYSLLLSSALALIGGFILGIRLARSRLRRLRAELVAARWLAEHDPLTGLLNRAGAQRHHAQQVAAGKAHVVVLIDLDDFKAVNDSWGHQAGDAQLAAVADRLATACSKVDAIASRLAGDEFLLLLSSTDMEVVTRQVTAVLAGLREPTTLPVRDGGTVIVTPSASAGIALPESGSTWTDLLRRADIALYRAKALRGRAEVYTRSMQPLPSPGARTAARLRDSEILHTI